MSKLVTSEFLLQHGRQTFCISVPEPLASKHARLYVYRVEYVAASAQWPEAYFVHVRREFHKNEYAYLGKLNTFTGQCELTARSSFPAHSFRFQLLNRVLARLWSGDQESVTRHGFRAIQDLPSSRKRARRNRKQRKEVAK